MHDPVDVLRRFNRAHTQRVGALDDSFLGSGRSLGPNRVLFEIGAEGAPVADLRNRLGLDSGYLSRLLRQLEGDGLVEVGADPDDGRRRRATLTRVGLDEWRRLDDRSDDIAEALLAPLSPRHREQLADALATAHRLICAATVEFVPVDPASPDAVWSVGRYFDELDSRFPGGFDPGDAWHTDAPAMRPPAGTFLVAAVDGRPIGCGGVQRIDDVTGEIKRMWLDAEWRGLGLGRRQLAALEAAVGALGYRRVVLDTNSSLTEAIAMYEGAGYEAIERYNDNPHAERWFAKTI